MCLVVVVIVISVEVDQLLACLSQAHAEVLVVKVYLHVLVSLLKLSNRHFLSLVKIRSIGQSAIVSWQIVIRLRVPIDTHALNIED